MVRRIKGKIESFQKSLFIRAFVKFLIDPKTQEVIGKFGVDKYGQPLFFPDAGKTEASLGSY